MSEWQTTNKAVSACGVGLPPSLSHCQNLQIHKCRQLHAPKPANTEIQTMRCKDQRETRISYLHSCLAPANWPMLPEFTRMMMMVVPWWKWWSNFYNRFFCTNPETQRRWPKSFQRSGWRGLSKIFRSGRWYNYTITTHRICLSEDILERAHTLLLLE